jgi:hypothetical protein
MAETIYLSNVVLSFPKLVEPSANTDFPQSPKKYSADFIMLPSHSGFAQFMAEVGKIANEKWKENAGNVLKVIQNDRRLRCYGNGAEKIKKDTFKPYDGYEGNVYITGSCNEDRPPQIVDADGKPIENTNTLQRATFARKLYGGCHVNAAVRPWAQDNQFGRGVRCELIAVQFLADGTPFGEAPANVEGIFGAVQPSAPATDVPPWAVQS